MHLSFYVISGNDERPCSLTVAFNHKYKVISLPDIIKPATATVLNYYTKQSYSKVISKQYGILFAEDMLVIYYGKNEGSSNDEKFSYTIPWLDYTFVRTEYLNTDGSIYKICYGYDTLDDDELPTMSIFFNDYDGECNYAIMTREKKIWHRGVKSFKWLKHITKPIVRETVGLNFEKEIGLAKHTYKGGILGTGIDMLPGETMLDTFIRFAAKNNLTL